jgi:hypothetical protein
MGERFRRIRGSIAAILGICLPGGILMYIVGVFYRLHGDHAWTTAGLKGVAAAAVILSTVVQLSKKSLAGEFGFIFMALTCNRREPLAPVSTAHADHGRDSVYFVSPAGSRGASERNAMNQIPAIARVFALFIAAHGGRRHGGLP